MMRATWPTRSARRLQVGIPRREQIGIRSSDEGGRRAAAIYTLIGTAKLDDIDPQPWLADVAPSRIIRKARRQTPALELVASIVAHAGERS